MKTIETGSIKKVGLLALTAALALPAFAATTGVAQADERGWNQTEQFAGRGWRGETFTGRVTRVKSDDEFDISVRGTIYNVYTRRDTSRRLSVRDRVEVTGRRVGNNDIRDAHVRILVNRR